MSSRGLVLGDPVDVNEPDEKPPIARGDKLTLGEPLSDEEALKVMHDAGPEQELNYLDQKDREGKMLSFEEWDRRGQLESGLDTFERYIGRPLAGFGRGVESVGQMAVGATTGRMSQIARSDAPWWLKAAQLYDMRRTSVEEGQVLSGVQFTDLMMGLGRTLGGVIDDYTMEEAPQEKKERHYQMYVEGFEAKKELAGITERSAMGEAAGGIATLLGADTQTAVKIQQEMEKRRDPAVSELVAMTTPLNPLNQIPFHMGGVVTGVGKAAGYGMKYAGMAGGRAAQFAADVTDIGAQLGRIASKVDPSLAGRSTAQWSRWAMRGAAASGAGGLFVSDQKELAAMAAFIGFGRLGLSAIASTGRAVETFGTQLSQGKRWFSNLHRTSKVAPTWAARTARILDNLGASQVADAAGGAAKGALTGATISGGIAGLTGGDAEDVGEAMGAGFAFGAVAGFGGHTYSKVSGADKALRLNAERLFFRESQRKLAGKNGDAIVEAFDKMPLEEQLAQAMVQAVSGPTAHVEILKAADFLRKTGNSNAGVFIGKSKGGGVNEIYINMDANRPAGTTALHEFAHLLAAREHPDVIKDFYEQFSTPEGRAKFEADYVNKYATTNKMSEADALAHLDGQDKNWRSQEWFAETGVQALHNIDWSAVIKKGGKAVTPARMAATQLRAQRAVLENAGVAFNADGTPKEPTFISDEFKKQGDIKMAQLMQGYVKNLADFSPVLDGQWNASRAADAAPPDVPPADTTPPPTDVPPTDTAPPAGPPPIPQTPPPMPQQAPAGPLRPPPLPRAPTPEQQAARAAVVRDLSHPDSPIHEPNNPLVGRRDSGLISGTMLPDALREVLTPEENAVVDPIQDLMTAQGGETLDFTYNGTTREGLPINWVVTKAGDLIARSLDVTALNMRLFDAAKDKSLPRWKNNTDAFFGDLQKVLDNWAAGRPGKTGIGEGKFNDILDFLKKKKGEEGVIRSFRVDRMTDAAPSGRTGWTFDYGKFIRRESPDVPASRLSRASPDVPAEPAKPAAEVPEKLSAWAVGQGKGPSTFLKEKPEEGATISREPKAPSERGEEKGDGRGAGAYLAGRRSGEEDVGRLQKLAEDVRVEREAPAADRSEREIALLRASGAEYKKLRDLADKEGRPANWKPDMSRVKFLAEAGEHRVWDNFEEGYVYKRTHPGAYGFIPRPDPSGYFGWALDKASPSDFFRRLAIGSRISGVADEFVGLWANESSIVHRQSFVEALDPKNPYSTFEQIQDYFTAPERGFVRVGRGGWWNKESGELVVDAKESNFIQTKNGPVPVDLIADEITDPAFIKALDDRAAEIKKQDEIVEQQNEIIRQMRIDNLQRKKRQHPEQFGVAHEQALQDLLAGKQAKKPVGGIGFGLASPDIKAAQAKVDAAQTKLDGLMRDPKMPGLRGAVSPKVRQEERQQASPDITRHIFQPERAERPMGAAVITDAERATIKKVANKKLTVEKLEAAVLATKGRFAEEHGWRGPLTFTGLREGKPNYKVMGYEFANDAQGKPLHKGSKEFDERTSELAGRIHNEVQDIFTRAQAGDEYARNVLQQASWYRDFRIAARKQFGGLGDLYADLLGATSPNTPARTNYNFAIDALHRATRGDFDELMPQWEKRIEQVEAAENKLLDYVRKLDKKTDVEVYADEGWQQQIEALKELRKFPNEMLPAQESGKLYGMNSPHVVRALVDLWRTVRTPEKMIKREAQAPKTLTFSGNLIGFRRGATIDVWAARLLNRIAGFLRIPIPAETSVTGDMIGSEGETTLQFGFGQEVFRKGAELIRGDKQWANHPDLPGTKPDDLQAIVWVLEKEIWARNNWTTEPGGSFEFEAALGGIADRARVRALRKIIDTGKSTMEQKMAAASELNAIQREVDRYLGGFSIQKGNKQPSDVAQARAIEQLHTSIFKNDAGQDKVVAAKVASTQGRYGSIERSIDMEVVVREGYDPTPKWEEMKKIARNPKTKQDSIFLARILRGDEVADPTFHRAGVEIFFNESKAGEAMEAALAQLEKMGAGFHTVVVDGRRSAASIRGEMPDAVGVRILRLPEYDVRFGDKSWLDLDDAAIAKKVEDSHLELDRLANDLMTQNPDVTTAISGYYEVRTEFSHEYAKASRPVKGKKGSTSQGGWRGRSVREAADAANR